MIKVIKILTFLLCVITFYGNEAAKFTQFKLIRGHGDLSEILPRNEDLEYPRKEGKILRALNKIWINYYSCLKEKKEQEIKPEIRRLLEGQYTEFKCDFCPRPLQNYEKIQWKYKPLSPEAYVTELEYLDLTPEMSLTTDKTLQIFNVMENFAGLYVCFHGKNVMSIYTLEVSKNDTTKKVEKKQIKEKEFEKFGYNFNVHYQWTDYTECSFCGQVGKKYKYGTCYVSAAPNKYDIIIHGLKNLVRIKKDVLQKYSRTQRYELFIKDDNSTSQVNNQSYGPEIIEKFKNGIPCASPYLMKIAPYFSKNFTAVKVIEKYCWEPCQDNNIFEVINGFGRIVELANNSAGIYSLFQKPPKVPPGIERRTAIADFGSNAVILCPGTSLTNTPVVWKVNDKIIYPEIISRQSKGRFTVDLVNRINIRRLRLRDSQIYSCWHKGKLIGTVNLKVEKKFKIGFDHHVTLIGIAAIIGTILLLGSKLLARELKMRKK